MYTEMSTVGELQVGDTIFLPHLHRLEGAQVTKLIVSERTGKVSILANGAWVGTYGASMRIAIAKRNQD
jgi:hypothetical protein